MAELPVLNTEQLKNLANKAKLSKEQQYLEASRQRLDKIISTKIRTTFIGALSSFEEAFGALWGAGKDEDELSVEELAYRNLWIEVRTKVLNNGNNQLRAAQTEIANNVIKWNRYHIDFTVKPLEEN